VTSRHRGPKRKLGAGYRMPSQHTSYLCGALLCCARYIFYRQVWYRALSLRYARIYARIQRSGIILAPRLPLCQIIFVAPPVTELARGEKSHTQSLDHSLNHSITQLI